MTTEIRKDGQASVDDLLDIWKAIRELQDNIDQLVNLDGRVVARLLRIENALQDRASEEDGLAGSGLI